MYTFGSYIRACRTVLAEEGRTRSDYTARKIAERIGVSHTYLAKLEGDRVERPSDGVVHALAEELGEDPDVLFALAGLIPEDVRDVVSQNVQMFKLIRSLKGRSNEEIEGLTRQVREGDW